MELSYCIVNTNNRDFLLVCLQAIADTHPANVDHEILLLDNASNDGSVEAVRARFPQVRVIACERRAGLAENNSRLLREAEGRFCLLLNEDSEILEGATAILLRTLRADSEAAAVGAQLVYPSGKRIGCAWRLPSVWTSLGEALFLHRWLVVQVGRRTQEVGCVQSAAMLVRRQAAEQVDFFDSKFFLYFEEIDFQARMRNVGWRILHAPAARAIHHQQFSHDRSPGGRRVVEFHRMRDLYMRKHHSKTAAFLSRLLMAWKYSIHTVVAAVVPGRHPEWSWVHVRQALRPSRGEGLRERADAYNVRPSAVPGSRA